MRRTPAILLVGLPTCFAVLVAEALAVRAAMGHLSALHLSAIYVAGGLVMFCSWLAVALGLLAADLATATTTRECGGPPTVEIYAGRQEICMLLPGHVSDFPAGRVFAQGLVRLCVTRARSSIYEAMVVVHAVPIPAQEPPDVP